MKKLILKLLLLGLPFAVLFFYREQVLVQVPNSHTKKITYLDRHIGDIELLILGSSQSYYGVDPALFALNAFNMANVSQSLYYDARLLEKLLPRMTSLKAVILGLSYFSFETDVSDSPEAFRCFFYQRYYDIPWPKPSLNTFLDVKNFSLQALYGRDITRTLLKDPRHADLAPQQTPLGWDRHDDSGPVTDQSGRETLNRHHSSMHTRNISMNLALVEKMLKELQARGVLTIIITTPVHAGYYRQVDPLRYQTFLATVRELSTRYHIVHLNYFDDPRFTDNDFHDSDHLNRNGAQKLSVLLNEQLNGFKATGSLSPVSPR